MKRAGLVLMPVILSLPLAAQTDWPVYGHDSHGLRYSPLQQINRDNVKSLKPAWTHGLKPGTKLEFAPPTEVTPIVAGGLLYYPTLDGTVVALEPETGKEVWSADLGVAVSRRGVTYWAGDRQNTARVIVGTNDGQMVALDAKAGTKIPGFGNEGSVNLRAGVADNFPRMGYHMTTPGAVFKNLIVTGAQGQENEIKGPLQDVRAWDVRTGKLVWTFHPNPHTGEPGVETWPEGSWVDAGSPAVWGAMAVDEARGLLYLPVGQPAPQYYGGSRPGTNLYSSSLVALDAATGKLRWHFQITHHDIWDYDYSAMPSLFDVRRNGRTIPAVAVISKASLLFILNRETGEPVYPVEERPVAQSDVPGEATSPTQPFPSRPEPLARQSIAPDEIFTGEPEHEKFCRDLVEKIGGIHNYGPYTPYSDKEYRLIFPGQVGGLNFGGVSVNPDLGYIFVNTIDEAGMGILKKEGDTYNRSSPLGVGTFYSRFWDPAKQWPCQPTPWAHLVAVDASTGNIAWKVTLGSEPELEAKGLHNTGSVGAGGSMATGGGLVFIGATNDKQFRAFDARTGQVLWQTTLDYGANATPITYMGRDGKQYVAIISSGLNAFALE